MSEIVSDQDTKLLWLIEIGMKMSLMGVILSTVTSFHLSPEPLKQVFKNITIFFTVLVSLIKLKYISLMYKNNKFLFTLSTSVCPFPVPIQKKTLSQRHLRNGRYLNNQTLWKYRSLMYMDVFNMFCLDRTQ